MYGFSDIVNLLGSSPGTALYCTCSAECSGTHPVKPVTIKELKDLKRSQKTEVFFISCLLFIKTTFINTSVLGLR